MDFKPGSIQRVSMRAFSVKIYNASARESAPEDFRRSDRRPFILINESSHHSAQPANCSLAAFVPRFTIVHRSICRIERLCHGLR